MRKWLRRSSRAVLMGVTWGAVWAPVAVLIGMIVDPDGSMDEMWVAMGAYPGFIAGVLFSALLWMAEGRRSIDELSFAWVGAWGAVAGLLVGVLPFVIGEPTGAWGISPWLLGVIVIGAITLLSTLSAVGSALSSRYAARRQTLAGAERTG